MKHGSLFSGIGGFDLAAQWMGWENIFHCEIAEFPRKILKYHFPKSICYEDIKKTDFTKHRGEIDIISGGFPCQPYSNAGKRKGKDDDRHLWPECSELFERYNHVSLWAKTLLGCLVGTTEWYSTKLLLTWKMKDMKHKRFLFQLAPRTPHTEEIEFGLLPTPTTQEPTSICNLTENGRRMTNNGADHGTQYKQGGRSLKNYMSHHQMLSTPMAQNRETTLEKTLDRKEKYGGEKRAMYLENYAVMGMLPTPTVNDMKNATLPPSRLERQDSIVKRILQTTQIGINSQLNPLFVAEMMGFPLNWTVLPFQSGETNQSKDMVMP